jgi:hypothetical protein
MSLGHIFHPCGFVCFCVISRAQKYLKVGERKSICFCRLPEKGLSGVCFSRIGLPLRALTRLAFSRPDLSFPTSDNKYYCIQCNPDGTCFAMSNVRGRAEAAAVVVPWATVLLPSGRLVERHRAHLDTEWGGLAEPNRFYRLTGASCEDSRLSE